MITSFTGKEITGVLSVLPENEYIFEDEIAESEAVRARRLKRIMGYGKRRRAKGDTTLSQMLLYGMEYLLDNKKIEKEEIGALIVVTLSPDYYLPQISSILHGELRLPTDVMCLDISQACSGFVIGLMQAFMLLEHMQDKKVVLCTGEIFNRKSSENEPKFTHPPFGGDIANICIVENSQRNGKIVYSSYTDGENRNYLQIHDGGFKYPMTIEKIQNQTTNLPFMWVDMDGSSVFNFVQKEVPPAIEEIVALSGNQMDDIDFFLFHQPNKFMLQKLAERLNIPFEKLPMDIVEKLGNSDSGTIPAVMTTDVSEQLLSGYKLCCLSGFGAGLSWTSLVMEIGNLSFCENIISNL